MISDSNTVGNWKFITTNGSGTIEGLATWSANNPLPPGTASPGSNTGNGDVSRWDHVHPNTCPPPTEPTHIVSKAYVDVGKTSATLGREGVGATTDILLTATVLTKIKYPDLIYKYGDVEIDTDTNKYGFKVKSAGTYVLSFFGLYSTNVNNPVIEASVYKTNVANPTGIITHIRSGGKLGASGDLRTGGASSVLELEVDDIVDVRAISPTTCTLSHKGMGFSIVKISSNA
jgi:hypothetical protein